MSDMHFSCILFGTYQFFLYICTNYRLLRMKKLILFCSLATALLLMRPAVSSAAFVMASPGIEQFIEDEITIEVKGQTVYVSGAQGLSMEVVSLTGRRLTTVKIESPSQKIELNVPKGCYILKIGKVVRKVSIR